MNLNNLSSARATDNYLQLLNLKMAVQLGIIEHPLQVYQSHQKIQRFATQRNPNIEHVQHSSTLVSPTINNTSEDSKISV